MDPALLESASASWAGVSALAVVLLGAFAFTGGRSRAPGSVAFGSFAILWGLHVLAGRMMAYAGPAVVERAHLAYLAFVLPLPFLLVEFARSFAPGGGRAPLWRAASIASVVAPLVALAALFLSPDLVYRGATTLDGRAFPDWGPLFATLAMAPFFLAFGAAVLALDHARRDAATARAATRAALLTAGLAAFVAFSAANNLVFYALDAAILDRLPLTDVYLVLFAALTLAMLAVGVRAAREALRAPSAKIREPALLVALAVLVPLVWGAVEGAIAYLWLAKFNTVGLWRLGGVALVAYALARTRLPDLTPRSRVTAATALGIAAAATTGGIAMAIMFFRATEAPLIFIVGVAAPIAALSPSVRLAHHALRVPRGPDLTSATLPRRLEAYRAALESSIARDSLRDDERFLGALREQLGIAPEVHEAFVVMARDTVLPPTDAAHKGYERLRLLGEGAQGRAWLARRRADDELVVLKEPRERDKATREALEKQARIARKVRHKHLVAVQEVVDSPNGPFLVLEHAAGGSLADLLAHGALAPRPSTTFALDTLDGLAALHDAGVVHGDVKPANILLDADGRAKVSDFGLARAISLDLTQTYVGSQGTLAVMAPEQLTGASPSKESDVYSVGALLYRLLVGEHYVDFAGLDEPRAREMIRTAPPRLPHPRVPAALEPVIRKALAKDPADRYRDAGEMRRALDAACVRL